MADAVVSLYKTADEYLVLAIERLQGTGSLITDFTVGSGARTLLEGHSAVASAHSGVVDQLRQDSYLATATDDALTAKAADNGVTRKPAAAATGSIRLTRAQAGVAVTIPAGWGTLLTVPVPGTQPVAFITTADAVFSDTDLFKVVAAQAVEGGTAGNIAINSKLLPVNPIAGFDTDGGFKAEAAFTTGVDEESDDALRVRVPLEVQARVNGRRESFLAAALGVVGVSSAAVLQAGDARGDATFVPADTVEVYFEGDASLTTAVGAACAGASILGQTVVTDDAASARVVADLNVSCLAGVDTTALIAAVKATVKAAVNAGGVGETIYASAVVKAVDDMIDVVGVNVPFTDLRLFTAADNTFGNLIPGPIKYLNLADADVAVAVTVL